MVEKVTYILHNDDPEMEEVYRSDVAKTRRDKAKAVCDAANAVTDCMHIPTRPKKLTAQVIAEHEHAHVTSVEKPVIVQGNTSKKKVQVAVYGIGLTEKEEGTMARAPGKGMSEFDKKIAGSPPKRKRLLGIF